MSTTKEKLTVILKGLQDSLGQVTIFLLDQIDGEELAKYPLEQDSSIDFIGEVSSNAISRFEDKAKTENIPFYVNAIEIFTEAQKIYVSRIDQNTILCIFGAKDSFQARLAERKIEAKKQEISSVLIE
jgi:predicted regulator of Ras-like GTPase activity (Roadblock/LC7/MglB family)